MKKMFDKEILLTIIISALLTCSLVIGASIIYNSNVIKYSPTDINWDVGNVEEAIDSLYGIETQLNNIKNIGDATASEILSGKKAVVKGSTIIGTMKNNGKLDWAPATASTYDVQEGYYSGGMLDSSLAYQNGYDEGYVAGKQTGADVLLNLNFTVKLPMKNEFTNESWSGPSTSSTTYTFTYNKGTSTQPSSSTATTATHGSTSFSMYCSDAVPKFVSNNEIWVIFTIRGHFVTEWDSERTTTYTVKYKWTDDKTAGTVTVTGNDLSWTSGSYTMKLNRNGTPTVTVS